VQERLVGDVVDGQQLDRGDPERLQVVERGLGRQAGVGPAQVLAHLGMAHGEALDVGLVDDGVGERDLGRPVALPIEGGVDHHGLGHRVDVVLVVALEVVVVGAIRGRVGQDVGALPADLALDRLGVRVDEQLRRVEAVALLRRVGTVDAVAVALARTDVRR
jgi:hypothetical protein